MIIGKFEGKTVYYGEFPEKNCSLAGVFREKRLIIGNFLAKTIDYGDLSGKYIKLTGYLRENSLLPGIFSKKPFTIGSFQEKTFHNREVNGKKKFPLNLQEKILDHRKI